MHRKGRPILAAVLSIPSKPRGFTFLPGIERPATV